MATRGVKIAGYSFIAMVMTLLVVTVTATVLEYTGISERLSKHAQREGKRRDVPLQKTGYYGQKLDYDPYRAFKVQHLHPYYIFSLP